MPIPRRVFLQGTLASGLLGSAARASFAGAQGEAKAFLEQYAQGWLPRETAANEASWLAATDVTEAHTADQVVKNQALSEYVGSRQVITTVKTLLARKAELDGLTVRQLEKVLLRAAESPGTIPEVVKARTEAEAKQSATQDGFTYTLKQNGQSRTVSANDIDRLLVESRKLPERQDVWETSKEIGRPLREGLLRLRDLRNQVAREMGYSSFFALQVADYGMTVPEMIALCNKFVAELQPLYQQLFTWAKHVLAKRYGADPPEGKIPAHWFTNRWAQSWPGLIEGIDMDGPFQGKPRTFITEQAERFYTSLGFPKLPPSFYSKSDLYPADPASGRKKNSHASAWHIDLRQDVRSLMSIEPDARWFGTAHHELGHIYYYISYSRPEVPYLLRAGANRAFHEGIGDLIGVAASQRKYLDSVGLLPSAAKNADPAVWLLDAALDRSVTFIPFSAGVMTHFERDLYEGSLPDDQLNIRWWELVGRYQGIVPPRERPAGTCDPATKTHTNDDPGQYYDYAIGTVLKFQLHDHIAREILKQDPRDCNYYGNAEVGKFLRDILRLGATRDWRAVLREATGQDLSAQAMVAYFEPLGAWLKEQNKGRKIGWS